MRTLQEKAVVCQGPAVPVQAVLPGCEAFFRSTWSPQPHILASIQNYLRGFAAHGRAIYARRKHIAAKLGIAVRTLARYLRWLSDAGWLETVKRTARTVIRKVAESLRVGPPSGPSLGPSIEVTPEAPKRILRRTEPPSPLVVFLEVKRRYAPKFFWEDPVKNERFLQELSRECGVPVR